MKIESKKEDSNLKKIKKEYNELEKKYSLPSFKELNENFSIEKISEFETELLLKSIRNFISEKFATYMRVVENFINPINAPMFVFSVVKSLERTDKERLSQIYKQLSQIEINLIELDLDYSEEKEAEFIKDSFKEWEKIKKELLEIIEKIKKHKNVNDEFKEKNYFG